MKKLFKYLTLLAIALVAFTGCEEDCNCEENPTGSNVKIVFELENDGVPVAWNEVMKIDGNVNELELAEFKYHFCNIALVDNNGGKTNLKDVILVNHKTGQTSFTFDAPPGNYTGLYLGVGLDSILNSTDPITVEQDNPLSSYQGMYWTWGTQYRFVLMDGYTNVNGTLGSADDLLIAYHPGAYEFYRTKFLEKPLTCTAGKTTTINVVVDIATIFDGPGGKIDIASTPTTHTTPSDYAVAYMYTINFNEAVALKK